MENNVSINFHQEKIVFTINLIFMHFCKELKTTLCYLYLTNAFKKKLSYKNKFNDFLNRKFKKSYLRH